jgi:hypothetical protein
MVFIQIRLLACDAVYISSNMLQKPAAFIDSEKSSETVSCYVVYLHIFLDVL